MDYRFLVTGGAGFFGRNLLDYLSHRQDVDALVSVDRLPLDCRLPGVHHLVAGIADERALAPLPRDVDRAVHLAAGRPLELHGSERQTRGFLDTNDLSQACFLAATNENAVGRTLNVSGREHLTIAELAKLVKRVLSSSSVIVEGPTKTTDVAGQRLYGADTHAALGGTPQTRFAKGIARQATWLSAAAHD